MLLAARSEQLLRENPELEHEGFRFARTADVEWQKKASLDDQIVASGKG